MVGKTLLKNHPIEEIPNEASLFFWIHANDFRRMPKDQVPFTAIRYVGENFSNFWSKFITIENALKLNDNPDFNGIGNYFAFELRNVPDSIDKIKLIPKSDPNSWNITVTHSPSLKRQSHCDIKWNQTLPKRPDRNEIRMFLAKVACLRIKPKHIKCPLCKTVNIFENSICKDPKCNHEFK